MRRAGAPLIVLLLLAASARGDKTGALAAQLRDSPDYKVRLSAALGLAESHDIRAVAAMTWALQNDREPTVRSVAALALANMLDESVPQGVRDIAINALERAAARDPDPKVQRAATRTLDRVRGLKTQMNTDAPAFFVAVGGTADVTGAAPPGATDRVTQTVKRTLRDRAPDLAQTWRSGALPTRADLQRAGTRGFFVGASVAQLDVVRTGSRAEVRCSVTMRVGPWTGADGEERIVAEKAASASGSGRVTAASSPVGVSSAKLDCVIAVVEQVTAREVVPFIRRTAASN